MFPSNILIPYKQTKIIHFEGVKQEDEETMLFNKEILNFMETGNVNELKELQKIKYQDFIEYQMKIHKLLAINEKEFSPDLFLFYLELINICSTLFYSISLIEITKFIEATLQESSSFINEIENRYQVRNLNESKIDNGKFLENIFLNIYNISECSVKVDDLLKNYLLKLDKKYAIKEIYVREILGIILCLSYFLLMSKNQLRIYSNNKEAQQSFEFVV